MDTADNFKNLSSREQKDELERVFNYIRQVYKDSIISGDIELVDISCNELKSGELVYDVSISTKGTNNTMSHEFFRRTNTGNILKESYLNDQLLNIYKACGYDTKELDDRKDEISKLPNNPEKVSLSKLIEDNKELVETAKTLGIPEDQIAQYAKFDKNNNISIDEDKINGISSQEIKGTDLVTTYHTMNDILGKNYETYKIVKIQNGQSAIFGVTKDGLTEQIKGLEFYNAKNMTLQQTNGDLKSVGVVTAFRVKSSSSIDRDQVVGLYSDRGQIDGFYSRGATNADGLIGEKVPSITSFNNYTSRIRSSLDTRENQDVSGEVKSAKLRTDDGCIDKVQNVTSEGSDEKDLNALAEDYSKIYGLDKDDLIETFEEVAEEDHSRDNDDEEIMEEAKDRLVEDEEELEENDNSYDEDDGPEHVMGTPWGNPNNH